MFELTTEDALRNSAQEVLRELCGEWILHKVHAAANAYQLLHPASDGYHVVVYVQPSQLSFAVRKNIPSNTPNVHAVDYYTYFIPCVYSPPQVETTAECIRRGLAIQLERAEHATAALQEVVNKVLAKH